MGGWGQACVGREVAGPATPQSDPPEMRSECVPQENKDSTEPGHSDVATDPFNDLQFPVSQVQQSLVELALALKDLHHRHKHSSTLNQLQSSSSYLLPQQQKLSPLPLGGHALLLWYNKIFRGLQMVVSHELPGLAERLHILWRLILLVWTAAVQLLPLPEGTGRK